MVNIHNLALGTNRTTLEHTYPFNKHTAYEKRWIDYKLMAKK